VAVPISPSNATERDGMAAAKPVALITGGARGIGRAIARHLVSSGWQVSIIDLPDSGLGRAFARERNVLVVEGDARDEEIASDAIAATIHRFGRLDGIVSNAGIMIRNSAARSCYIRQQIQWLIAISCRATCCSVSRLFLLYSYDLS
jgi:NAD(P)-dependent dehydrogenase (short-subunit alcohol dehydrogenase family)